MQSTSLPTLLKPGLMERAVRPGLWQVHDPRSLATVRVSLDGGGDDAVSFRHLLSPEGLWRDGVFQPDLYFARKTLLAHDPSAELNFEINYACPYSCLHCFQHLSPLSSFRATPSWDALAAAAGRIMTSPAREVSLTGGDIFLHPSLWRLLQLFFAGAPHLTLRLLVSGGALDLDAPLTRQHLQQLRGRPVLVKCDFYGHTASLHDAFTAAPGSFHRLVAIVELLRAAGVPVLPTGVITRGNFDTRFELYNFLFNLTDDCFTLSSLFFPSPYRPEEHLARVRPTPEQFAELMDERLFQPLASEFLSFEPPCAGDCQFPVVRPEEPDTACSFLPPGPARPAALDECDDCPARTACRRCPSFLATGHAELNYCPYARLAHQRLLQSVQDALAGGYSFIHAHAAQRCGLAEVH